MKVVVTDWANVAGGEIPFEKFSALGNVEKYDLTEPEQVAERIGDAEAVLCNKTLIKSDAINKCGNLKYIGLFATGYNNIDIDAATQKGIVVCNAGSYSTYAVAQHTFAHILEHYSKISLYNHDVQEGKWISSPVFSYFPYRTSELYGKTISIIGYGSIGKKVAEIADAFGMNVVISTRSKPEKCKYSLVNIDEAFKLADVLTIHCPLTEQTRGLVNLQRLKIMKPTAILINTARGPIIVEEDLAYALNNGIIAGAGLDVLKREPMREDTPLRNAKNCIITPHTAWAAYETRIRLVDIVIDNLLSYISGNIKNKVN